MAAIRETKHRIWIDAIGTETHVVKQEINGALPHRSETKHKWGPAPCCETMIIGAVPHPNETNEKWGKPHRGKTKKWLAPVECMHGGRLRGRDFTLHRRKG